MPILNMIYGATGGGGGGWQPGANTLCYYPLDSTNTVNDLSGNNYTFTNSGVTFGVSQGVDCASFSPTSRLTNSLPMPSDFTIIGWVYHNSYNDTQVTYNMGGNPGVGNDCIGYWYNSTNTTICLGQFNGAYETTETKNITGKWSLVAITYTAGSNILYIDGASEITRTDTISFIRSQATLGNFSGSLGLSGCLSKIIIEDKVRTAQEIADYYDLTKGDYGIS